MTQQKERSIAIVPVSDNFANVASVASHPLVSSRLIWIRVRLYAEWGPGLASTHDAAQCVLELHLLIFASVLLPRPGVSPRASGDNYTVAWRAL